ncbi:hypothetical protein ASZ78_009323 [Callipepla squamata]|uniref:Protein maelstrom homolog n=1 Tax=Callipepla squamata TaxID=9009 RepID=A0A226MX09_CALSU|nr:hypothetical protein ASZ78_009323 [Callipepla squamata]
MSRSQRSRSSYYFFVRERLPLLKQRGLPVSRVSDGFPHLTQEWAVRGRALLSKEEKMFYAEKALKWKEKKSLRAAAEEVKAQEGAGRVLNNQVPAHVTSEVFKVTSFLDASAISWKSDRAVVADIFYFLNIYSHGKLPSHCDQRFLPCEIGCVKYSLQEGIMADFHHFIDAEVPPRGFRYHCQAASEYQWRRRVSDGRFRISWCLERMASVAGVQSSLELLTVEDLVIKLYQKKYQKEPSETWVSKELDVVLWDFSSNTSYCISRSLAGVYGVSLTAAHLPQDCDSSGNTNLRRVILDAGRFQEMKARASERDKCIFSPSCIQDLVPSRCEFEISSFLKGKKST